MFPSPIGPIDGSELIRGVLDGQRIWLTRPQVLALIATPEQSSFPIGARLSPISGGETINARQGGQRVAMTRVDFETFLAGTATPEVPPPGQGVTTLTGRERLFGVQGETVTFDVSEITDLRKGFSPGGGKPDLVTFPDATHYVSSAANGYAGVPLRPEYSPLGNLIDIRARLSQSNWQAASGIIGGMWVNGDSRSEFKFYFDTTGRLGFAFMNVLGAATYQTIALPAADFPPNSIRDVRVTRDPAKGLTTFYFSTDRGENWIQLGAAIPGMAGNIFKPAAGTRGLILLQAWGGGEQLVTRMYEFQLRIAGTLVANPVFETQSASTSATTTFADSANPSVIWTVGNGAVIV